MSDLHVKHYVPNRSGQSIRISIKEWNRHDQRIRELHAEGCTSEQARARLQEETRAD